MLLEADLVDEEPDLLEDHDAHEPLEHDPDAYGHPAYDQAEHYDQETETPSLESLAADLTGDAPEGGLSPSSVPSARPSQPPPLPMGPRRSE